MVPTVWSKVAFPTGKGVAARNSRKGDLVSMDQRALVDGAVFAVFANCRRFVANLGCLPPADEKWSIQVVVGAIMMEILERACGRT